MQMLCMWGVEIADRLYRYSRCMGGYVAFRCINVTAVYELRYITPNSPPVPRAHMRRLSFSHSQSLPCRTLRCISHAQCLLSQTTGQTKGSTGCDAHIHRRAIVRSCRLQREPRDVRAVHLSSVLTRAHRRDTLIRRPQWPLPSRPRPSQQCGSAPREVASRSCPGSARARGRTGR